VQRSGREVAPSFFLPIAYATLHLCDPNCRM
jgi:hypothetical protein